MLTAFYPDQDGTSWTATKQYVRLGFQVYIRYHDINQWTCIVRDFCRRLYSIYKIVRE